MITEKMKNAAASKNALSQERFVEKVRSGIRNELKLTAEDEIAILRKAVALLFDLVSTLHPEVIDNEEFKAYNLAVEAIKAAKKENRYENTVV